jgi:hypothetical protein
MPEEDSPGESPLFTPELLDFLRNDLANGSRFVACHAPVSGIPSRILGSARLEVSDGSAMPRILLDPGSLRPEDLSVETFKADAARLYELVTTSPEEFKKLIELVNNPRGFIQQAKHLGLTEADFARHGGGWLGLLILMVAAVVTSGCSGGGTSTTPAQCTVTVTCTPSPVTGSPAVAQDYSVDFSFAPTSTLRHAIDHNFVHGDVTYEKGGKKAAASKLLNERVTVVRGSGATPTKVSIVLPIDIYPPGTTLWVKYDYVCPKCGAKFAAETSVKMP